MPKKVRHARGNATGRNETVRFVALRHYMLKCPAWETLSGTSMKILIEVWKRHNGVNNGEIVFGTREAETIGIGKSQTAVALADLQQRGFLKVARNSTFTLKTKEARTWILTGEPYQDQPATKDFMRWLPPAGGAARIKSRSALADRQSGVPDREPRRATKLPTLVRCTGLSEAEEAESRSGVPDTSSYHGSDKPTPVSGCPDATASTINDVAGPGGGRSASLTPCLPPESLVSPTDKPRAVRRGPRDHSLGADASPADQPACTAPVATQIDLEELVAARGGRVGSGDAPRNQLRVDLVDYLGRSPRGETAKLAARIGLSRPQLANFKSGTYDLNPTAAARLRQILDEEAAR